MSASLAAAAPSPAPPPGSASGGHLWKSQSFGFADLLDTINPLQHIPIVSSIYRWLTGDQPGDAARVVGDTLFTGPLGLATSLTSVLSRDDNGHDLGDRALAAVFGSAKRSPTPDAAVAADAPEKAVRPDHPPIPLAAATHGPVPAVIPPTGNSPEQVFLAQRAMLQRQLANGRLAPPTAPIALEASGPPLPQRSNPFIVARPPQPQRRSDTPANPTGATSSEASSLPAAQSPVDVSQKMQDALDKYMRLQNGGANGPTADPPRLYDSAS